jgi:translocator protein
LAIINLTYVSPGLTISNDMDYGTFYQNINKPFFAPPPITFGIAWAIIYPLIGIAFIYLLFLFFKGRVSSSIVGIFVLNLAANFSFGPILLGAQNILLATLDIYLVLATIALFENKIFRVSKIIFYTLLPYLIWIVFATILLTTIVFVNNSSIQDCFSEGSSIQTTCPAR